MIEFSRKLISLLVILIMTYGVKGQCAGFPAATADAPCENYFPLTNNANVNSGQSFGVCGQSDTPPTYSNVNLSGGVLRVCSDTRISGSFNSGTIVVSCGATLTFTGGLTLNSNSGIVNYGTVVVNGTINFQNSNNYVYNESTTSRLFVSGNVTYPQNNGQNAYLKNNGYIQIDGTFEAKEGGFTCLGPDSKLVCNNLQYLQNCNNGPHNRFTYAGGTDPGILQYTNNATMKGIFTNSSSVHVYRSTSANAMSTGGCTYGSWGSATVTNSTVAIAAPSAPSPGTCVVQNCYTTYLTLPVELISFNAEWKDDDALISWATFSEENNSHFNLLRSADAESWEVIARVEGQNSSSLNNYAYLDESTLLTDNFYRLEQFDFDGLSVFSNVIKLRRDVSDFILFPNPASSVLYLMNENELNLGEIHIYDIQGRDITSLVAISAENNRKVSISVVNLSSGVYVLSKGNSVSNFKKI